MIRAFWRDSLTYKPPPFFRWPLLAGKVLIIDRKGPLGDPLFFGTLPDRRIPPSRCLCNLKGFRRKRDLANIFMKQMDDTIDGSEIQFPTTVWMHKTSGFLMGWRKPNLNWLAGILNHQQYDIINKPHLFIPSFFCRFFMFFSHHFELRRSNKLSMGLDYLPTFGLNLWDQCR